MIALTDATKAYKSLPTVLCKTVSLALEDILSVEKEIIDYKLVHFIIEMQLHHYLQYRTFMMSVIAI